MIGVTNHIAVTVCANPADAVAKGYSYNQWPDVPTPLNLEKAVIVQNGTVAGNPTVDLILVDETGKKYVALITARLLQALPLEKVP